MRTIHEADTCLVYSSLTVVLVFLVLILGFHQGPVLDLYLSWSEHHWKRIVGFILIRLIDWMDFGGSVNRLNAAAPKLGIDRKPSTALVVETLLLLLPWLTSNLTFHPDDPRDSESCWIECC